MKSRGFVTVYLCILLSVVLIMNSSIALTVERYHEFQTTLEEYRRMNRIEALVIMRIRQNFLHHHTDDETIETDGFTVTISYRKYKCTFTIESENFFRERCLKWDEIEEKVADYY